jgi:hypothetical protein
VRRGLPRQLALVLLLDRAAEAGLGTLLRYR